MEIDQLPNDLQPHPNPLPNLHHRKIELQSPLDLIYLRETIAAAARQKLDLHFSPETIDRTKTGGRDKKEAVPNGGGEKEDLMRARVIALVNEFLDRTFDSATHSISINGNDVSPYFSSSNSLSEASNPNPTTSDHSAKTTTSASTRTIPSPSQQESEREGINFQYEAYDPRLSTKLASLYAELEKETLAVSQLRRTAPAEGARLEGDALLRTIQEEGKLDIAGSSGDGIEGDESLKLDPLPDSWREEVGEMYERGLGDLRRLGGGIGAGSTVRSGVGESSGGTRGGSLTETLGKAQRARDAAMEFE
jgi:Kinetochore protein Mis14 like